jgi:hypothetical protein
MMTGTTREPAATPMSASPAGTAPIEPLRLARDDDGDDAARAKGRVLARALGGDGIRGAERVGRIGQAIEMHPARDDRDRRDRAESADPRLSGRSGKEHQRDRTDDPDEGADETERGRPGPVGRDDRQR